MKSQFQHLGFEMSSSDIPPIWFTNLSQFLMFGSWPSNFKIGVECQIFVIAIFFVLSQLKKIKQAFSTKFVIRRPIQMT